MDERQHTNNRTDNESIELEQAGWTWSQWHLQWEDPQSGRRWPHNHAIEIIRSRKALEEEAVNGRD